MKLLFSAIILAHSWYPSECCSDHDCQPVPCGEISRAGKDFVWQHEGRRVTFSAASEKTSPDGACHVCAAEKAIYGRCIFLSLES